MRFIIDYFRHPNTPPEKLNTTWAQLLDELKTPQKYQHSLNEEVLLTFNAQEEPLDTSQEGHLNSLLKMISADIASSEQKVDKVTKFSKDLENAVSLMKKEHLSQEEQTVFDELSKIQSDFSTLNPAITLKETIESLKCNAASIQDIIDSKKPGFRERMSNTLQHTLQYFLSWAEYGSEKISNMLNIGQQLRIAYTNLKGTQDKETVVGSEALSNAKAANAQENTRLNRDEVSDASDEEEVVRTATRRGTRGGLVTDENALSDGEEEAHKAASATIASRPSSPLT